MHGKQHTLVLQLNQPSQLSPFINSCLAGPLNITRKLMKNWFFSFLPQHFSSAFLIILVASALLIHNTHICKKLWRQNFFNFCLNTAFLKDDHILQTSSISRSFGISEAVWQKAEEKKEFFTIFSLLNLTSITLTLSWQLPL